jgi:hypothetical protein
MLPSKQSLRSCGLAINKRETLQKVKVALAVLFQREESLLNLNASERSISHKFAEYLQKQFPNLNVDCEYNRHGSDIKMLQYHRPRSTRTDKLAAYTVLPDIVVHRRGKDDNNLLVIELKKSNSGENHTLDFEKLKAFTGNQFKYKIGLFLLIDVERRRLSEIRHFYSGKEVSKPVETDLIGLGHGG